MVTLPIVLNDWELYTCCPRKQCKSLKNSRKSLDFRERFPYVLSINRCTINIGDFIMLDFSRFNTKEMSGSERFSLMFIKAIGTCYYKDVKLFVAA